jgi:hypothetical protein
MHNRKTHHFLRHILVLGSGCLLSSGSMQAGYVFQDIIDNADPTFNQALSINNTSTIAGYFGSGTPGHPNKGYTVVPPYGQANFANENFPGSAQTQVTGINTAGNTVGFWVDSVGTNHGFTDIGGTFTTADDPLTTATPAFNQLLGLNDTGFAAGFYNDAAGDSHAYEYNIGTKTFTAVTPAGAVSAVATGVNNAGQVSGFFTNAGGATLAFILTGNTFFTYDVPGSTNTQFLGINNLGQAVGFYVDSGMVQHGLLYNIGGNTFQNVDDPNGLGTTTINGLNDKGQLVGFYVNGAGNTIGLLATQTPEPASLSLVGLGLLFAGLRLRRRTSTN